MHKLPDDFSLALKNRKGIFEFWQKLTPLAKNEWICWVTSAKQATTRERRIVVGIDKMKKGMKRPCCWQGCGHRK
jgi:uncharacterized protein YdeI (YjbR/CyaY-like superfamily)